VDIDIDALLTWGLVNNLDSVRLPYGDLAGICSVFIRLLLMLILMDSLRLGLLLQENLFLLLLLLLQQHSGAR